MQRPDAAAQFVDHLAKSLTDDRFVRAVLARYRGQEPDLQRVNLRRIRLRGEPHLQFVHRYATRDITRNLPIDEGVATVRTLVGVEGFRSGHLHTRGAQFELTITQRGQAHLRELAQPDMAGAGDAAADEAHNREKQRMLPMDRPFLAELGLTTAQHELVPSMARKWKQINKFVEVFAGAVASSRLAQADTVSVVDFGAGKGYLTFAVHDWLTQVRGIGADVTGVELRPDLVRLCEGIASRLGLLGLHFEMGDLRTWQPRRVNVVIALHACDTATDHAIDLGLRGGADIILCSPCCHKQIRPQLLQPHPLRPILQHGVHLGQEAEMLTDSLRALLLEAAGYSTQIFEFVSLEHTNKNKMILAVRRPQPGATTGALEQIESVKSFYGIREHCLETLLRQRGALPAA